MAELFPPEFLENLKQVVLRSESRTRVKSLSGFDRKYRLPDKASAHVERLILGMAEEDLGKDIEKYFALLRDHFQYRRKELEVSRDEGQGVIRTPDFEYSIQALIDAQDTSNLLWRRRAQAPSPTGSSGERSPSGGIRGCFRVPGL